MPIPRPKREDDSSPISSCLFCPRDCSRTLRQCGVGLKKSQEDQRHVVMYKRRGHVWGNRRAGHPRKLTSKYIYTVGLDVSTGVCLPMGILVYKVMIQNTSRPRPSVGNKPKKFTKMKLHAFPTKCVGLSPISQKSYLKLKTK